MSPANRRAVSATVLIIAISCALPALNPSRAADLPSDERAAAHVLNRIGFGPTPGSIEMVRRLGILKYIDQQLHPERLDDAALQTRLRSFDTLEMSTAAIAREYFLPALIERRDRKRDQPQSPSADVDMAAPPRTPQPAVRQVIAELSEQKLLRAVYSERQLQEVLVDFWFNHFNVFAGKGPERMMLTEYERDAIRPHVLGKFRDLLGATAHSPAMLFYLDNWMSTAPTEPLANQGNLQGPRNRPRAPGGRRDQVPPRPSPANRTPQNRRPAGLNENYARELMELHTLGVDGGYTQQDIVEVARAFTGWTIQQPRLGGGYRFEPRLHDNGAKRVLGHTIKPGGGEKDGEEVLDILARHPATARFVATKLARRFVGDDPPPGLVGRAADRFRQTDGDLREVVRTIVTSPEFFAPDAHRAKIKTPFEFIASAVRASAASVEHARGLTRAVQELGMPLYFAQPPTGYEDSSEAWVNTGALLARMNFALSLVENQVPGIRMDLGAVTGTSRNASGEELAAARERLLRSMLQGTAADATVSTLRRATTSAQLVALTLGSPEFQRR